jgi:basic membrane lipoprotein Med (substrate-binding protein (PBP1-ABC) superfamily)
VVAVAVITGVVVLAWPSHPSRALPPARAKVYTAFDACLLTDADGVSGSGAAPVWSGMQAASGQTSGKVSFLPVLGPDTQADAVPFVNTLVQRRCDLVLAVGRSEVAAVLAQAPQFPKVRFVVVGAPSTSTSASPAPNVTVVPVGSASSVAAAVQGLVTQAADSVTTS